MYDIDIKIQSWPLKAPFHITDYSWNEVKLLTVRISCNGFSGWGEAAGVYYLDETVESMYRQLQAVRVELSAGISRQALQFLLPSGGARCAVDAALWDLECKTKAMDIWQLCGIQKGAVNTVTTIGIDRPLAMSQTAKALATQNLKVKIDGDNPLAQITAVRSAKPNAHIVVDVNQGWNFSQLLDFAPQFKALGVAMIEQPLPRSYDHALEGYISPVPLCADESCLDRSELDAASRRYQMINIKLDKTGGLTEALALAQEARKKGLGLMVGNMMGTSLAMAPAFVLARICDFVDIDGPLFLTEDRDYALRYDDAEVSGLQPRLWG